MKNMRFLFAAFLCLAPLWSQTPPKTAFDKPTLDAYVRHALVIPQNVTMTIDDPKPSDVKGFKEVAVHLTFGKASKDLTFYVSDDGLHIFRGDLYDVRTSPFEKQLAKLKTDLSPSMGTPGAPVVLVLFSDFECPLCKQEAQTLKDHLLATYPTQVRLYFKDFPLDPIHPWARPAAIAGRCIFRESPKAFWDYHDWTYAHQEELKSDNLKAKIMEFAGTKNIDAIQLGRCMEEKATEGEVNDSVAQGKSLGVDATPTIFVNGRPMVGNVPWEQLKTIIDDELRYQETAHNAGEKCCEVKVPGALNN
jgi:protein-disulfide isomerase